MHPSPSSTSAPTTAKAPIFTPLPIREEEETSARASISLIEAYHRHSREDLNLFRDPPFCTLELLRPQALRLRKLCLPACRMCRAKREHQPPRAVDRQAPRACGSERYQLRRNRAASFHGPSLPATTARPPFAPWT